MGIDESTSRSRPDAGGRAARARALLPLFVVACLAAGCASRSPAGQDFVELQSEHFVITSSLDPEDTLAFARSLEFFHAGVRALLGPAAGDDDAPPTPVFVFDDRSPGRPFAVKNEATFLVDGVDVPILVFRGARDFAARATPEFRHRHARWLLRERAPEEPALWYEEGVARLAGSMSETARGVHVGRTIETYRRAVLDWRDSALLAAFQRSDLSDASLPERERFAAQAWAIAHTLEFEDRRQPDGRTLLDAYQQAFASADPAVRARAFSAIGLDAEKLVGRIYAHLEKPRDEVRMLEARGFDASRLSPVPLGPAVSRARLGILALQLERPALAREYLEKALARDPELVLARVALAAVRAGEGDLAATEALLESDAVVAALRADSADPALVLAASDAQRALAVAARSPEQRARALASARALAERALAADAYHGRAALALALSYLDVPGEDPAAAERWVEAARAVGSGSFAPALARARLDAAIGRERAAAIQARQVVTRAQDALVVDAARALLESLGEGRR